MSQHADGIFGPFIVRQTPQRDPNSNLYDYDLNEHILTISSWSHSALAYNLDLQESVDLSSILINGKGAYFVSIFTYILISHLHRPSFHVLKIPVQN